MGFIKRTITSFFKILGYRISRIPSSESFSPDMEDDCFKKAYKKSKPYTLTSPERMYALYKAVEYVVKNSIEGGFVECGVWKGGSSMLATLSFIQFNDKSRNIYLYDTFAGMSKPTEEDEVIGAKVDSGFTRMKWEKMEKSNHNEWTYAPLEEVRKNIESTGYPTNKVSYIKGKVEDTIPRILPGRIAVLRLDTDWYESTKHELEHLFPLLVPGGVLILDDYGHWAGAKKAVDEYIKENNISILLNRIDGTGRIGVKKK